MAQWRKLISAPHCIGWGGLTEVEASKVSSLMCLVPWCWLLARHLISPPYSLLLAVQPGHDFMEDGFCGQK